MKGDFSACSAVAALVGPLLHGTRLLEPTSPIFAAGRSCVDDRADVTAATCSVGRAAHGRHQRRRSTHDLRGRYYASGTVFVNPAECRLRVPTFSPSLFRRRAQLLAVRRFGSAR